MGKNKRKYCRNRYIKSGLPIIAGVYQITNRLDSRVYIGSSIDVLDRGYQHITNKEKRGCQSLFIDISKYGVENFEFEILETVDVANYSTRKELSARLFELEQKHFDRYYAKEYLESRGVDNRFIQLTYNKNAKANGPRGIVPTDESKDKQRRWWKEHPEAKEKLEECWGKYRHIPWRKGIPSSPLEKFRKLIGGIASGYIKILVGVDNTGQLNGPYYGYRDCAKKLKGSHTAAQKSYKTGCRFKSYRIRELQENDILDMKNEDVDLLQKVGYEIGMIEESI